MENNRGQQEVRSESEVFYRRARPRRGQTRLRPDRMKTLTYLLLPCLALAAAPSVSRDGHGGASHSPQPQGNQPPTSSYEGPPPPYDQSFYDPQPPPVPGPQFQYHSFQPNYLEPGKKERETFFPPALFFPFSLSPPLVPLPPSLRPPSL